MNNLLKGGKMNLLDIFLVSIGLAMDAFTVSICKGLSMKKENIKKTMVIGIYFGFFQMLMPVIGYLLGARFSETLESVDHWIAFFLLGFLGIKMIKESFEEKDFSNDSIDIKTMTILSIATSIDALAIGITYAFLDVKNIYFVFSVIGVITFFLSVIGVKIGKKFGDKLGNKTEILGGAILLIIGTKILLEHLGILC